MFTLKQGQELLEQVNILKQDIKELTDLISEGEFTRYHEDECEDIQKEIYNLQKLWYHDEDDLEDPDNPLWENDPWADYNPWALRD